MSRKKLTPQQLEQRAATTRSTFKRFFDDHGRFPTREDIVRYRREYGFVTHRTLERRYGGVVAFRALVGLPDVDLRKTAARRAAVRGWADRHAEAFAPIGAALVARFGAVRVHFEEKIADDERRRTDARVFGFDDRPAFMVDAMVPTSPASRAGCLNVKLAKIARLSGVADCPIVFADCGVGEALPFERVSRGGWSYPVPVYTVGRATLLAAVRGEVPFPFPVAL